MKGQSAIAHSQYCSIAWNSRHGQLFLLTLFHRSVQGYEIWMLNSKTLRMLQLYVYCLLICHKLTKVSRYILRDFELIQMNINIERDIMYWNSTFIASTLDVRLPFYLEKN